MFELFCKLKITSSSKEKDSALNEILNQKQCTCIVSFLNFNSFDLSQEDQSLNQALLGSTYLFRDGIAVSILLRLAGKKAGLNMNGTDLIPDILNRASGMPLAIFGTSEPSLSQAVGKLRERGHNIVCQSDGFQDFETYRSLLRNSQFEICVLGMGVPKQELLSDFLSKEFPQKLFINGGAILDFISGRVSRAPRLIRLCRLEWLYRLILEPKRLWRRYVLGLLRFFIYAYMIQLKR